MEELPRAKVSLDAPDGESNPGVVDNHVEAENAEKPEDAAIEGLEVEGLFRVVAMLPATDRELV